MLNNRSIQSSSEKWNDLAILQSETETIINIVRKIVKPKNASQQNSHGKKTIVSNSVEKSHVLKKNGNKSRLTIEVLDGGSPDHTPRQNEESEIAADLINSNNHSIVDGLNYQHERTRVLHNSDIFVSAPIVLPKCAPIEKKRIKSLENAQYQNLIMKNKESIIRCGNVQHEYAAQKLQSFVRGFMARQRVQLTCRLQNVDHQTEWIEVRNSAQGDVWFYNRLTGQSQWDRPIDMYASIVPLDTKKTINVINNSKNRNSSTQKMKYNQTWSSEKKINNKKESIIIDVRNGINSAMGAERITSTDNLFSPNGFFKAQLRTTVSDALLQSRFDSISSTLADDKWIQGQGESFLQQKRESVADTAVIDSPHVNANNDISLKEPTFVDTLEQTEENMVCFGCWSAGTKRNCILHFKNSFSLLESSQTMLLCRNWELGIMRRRYRSEEIQEIFMKKVSTLSYDVKRKQFLNVVEHRHQVYRGLKNLIGTYNFRMLLWIKIKRWLQSLSDEVRINVTSDSSLERIKMMRLRRTLQNGIQVNNYLRDITTLLPSPPITGSSWPESLGESQVLVRRADRASGQEVEVIFAHPFPSCGALFSPRDYHIPVPSALPMPVSNYPASNSEFNNNMPIVKLLPDDTKAAWLEKMSSSITGAIIHSTLDQIVAITPMVRIGIVSRLKQPKPFTIKLASMGRKPEPGNICIGGLAIELLIYQLTGTYIPPQYGNLMIMDRNSISPGSSPEVVITFDTLQCEPITQVYALRALEHQLNYRRAPTITANSAAVSEKKHYYGFNRPEQTGEQESHGFRTTCWARNLLTNSENDPSTFTPGPHVVSLNIPASNRSVTTHADYNYPFCEPTTRDNSSLDFFHLILQGAISCSKSQVFTVLTVQEPGLFLRECRDDYPLGHLVVSVYRSWALTQRNTIEEFKTDDRVSYWYHRRTGQTFWERPLYEEEEPTTLCGGTILDQVHCEEPLTVHKGHEGAERRYVQGEFRKMMLAHHETDTEAKKRRLAARGSVEIAKDRGLLQRPPSGPGAEIGINNLLGEALQHPIESNENVSSFQPEHCQLDDRLSITGIPNTRIRSAIEPSAAISINQLSSHTLSESMNKVVSALGLLESSTPQEIVQLGMSMGMSLIGTDNVQNIIDKITNVGGINTSAFDALSETNLQSGYSRLTTQNYIAPPNTSSEITFPNCASMDGVFNQQFALNAPYSGKSSDSNLNHSEQKEQRELMKFQLDVPLTAVHIARSLIMQPPDPTETPDAAPGNILTIELPLNADHDAKETVPLIVYPELSSWPVDGPPKSICVHRPAGEGTTFVLKRNGKETMRIQGSEILRKSIVSVPVGFFNAIIAKHIAKQMVDYLPIVPNLPQSRTVGRVKPRSSAIDWIAISFDPWSAGKNPLNTEFIPSLASKADKLFGNDPSKAHDLLDQMRDTNKDAFVSVEDKEGLAQTRAEITKGQLIAQDFAKACSLCRHSKFGEVEQMVNQPDWNVPVDYQDDMGNTLLHVVTQNGNRRLVKLCLRRGANLNSQNLTGQTPLHFAFGYGYVQVGEYLVKKGADDSIRNKDGLTCYEGTWFF